MTLANTVSRRNLLNINFMNVKESSLLWYKVQRWIKGMDFGSYNPEIRSIILGESRRKYKLNKHYLTGYKIIIYSKQNKSFLLKQVKFEIKDPFHAEKYWAETNQWQFS